MVKTACISVSNGEVIFMDQIPVLTYQEFYQVVSGMLESESHHCVNYYGMHDGPGLKFICCIADDESGKIHVLSHEMDLAQEKHLLSLTPMHHQMHIFEREIHENFAVDFTGHPWLKPVRSAQKGQINDYPFFRLDSDETHEVGVGPIHAGVIEPGHFRFLCHGETVKHLEIQLGWQHRGVEQLFVEKEALLQRHLLAESIAGDTAVGHSLAFVQAMESLSGEHSPPQLQFQRAIALELERIAMHTADLSALCTDIAYQLGSTVFGALRTPVINFFQKWCGNRFAKGLIRFSGSHYALGADLKEKLSAILSDYEERFVPMAEKFFSMNGTILRFRNIGTVSKAQVRQIGAVGMAARVSGLKRDIRSSHPVSGFQNLKIDPVLLVSGDVWARALLRKEEILQSITLIRHLISQLDETPVPMPLTKADLLPHAFVCSLTEGWRGEISHCAVTDNRGKIRHYKIKDPSMHNWMALALALRNLEISDFPINNKSFNLSYCGHDL